MDRQDNSHSYVNESILYHSDFIQLKERVDPFLTELVQKLKQHNIRINYYGTNSPDKLEQLFAAGVEFPLVDDVSAMMKTAGELGIKPVTPIFEEKND